MLPAKDTINEIFGIVKALYQGERKKLKDLWTEAKTYLWEHSVILTFPVAVVGTAQTPDPECRYTWHSAAPTSDCC